MDYTIQNYNYNKDIIEMLKHMVCRKKIWGCRKKIWDV